MDMWTDKLQIAFPQWRPPYRRDPAWSDRAVALAIFASASIYSGSAAAQQTLSDTNSLRRNLATEKRPNTRAGDLSNVFETRWPVAETVFILGGDGVVRSPRQQRIDDAPAARFDSGYTKRADQPNLVDGRLSRTRIDDLDREPAAAGECDPSVEGADKIRALVDQAAARHGVDAVFAEAIAWSESGFDRSRNSPKGARGPMQLMPATAIELGVHDICDAADNIDGGVRHLRALLDEFKNPLLAAAAYNAGAEPVYRYGGIPPYPETVGFVARVVNFTLGLKAPGPRAGQAKQENAATADAEAGVITQKRPGEFIGGVMQF